ncbi:MAG: hypothetical protein MUF77_08930 [Leptospira sp.]|nr:hypothetical protein [Leptospira sp.]
MSEKDTPPFLDYSKMNFSILKVENQIAGRSQEWNTGTTEQKRDRTLSIEILGANGSVCDKYSTTFSYSI